MGIDKEFTTTSLPTMLTPGSTPLPSLKEIIEKHQLYTKKSLGQHFLLDPIILEKIAGCALIDSTGIVIEVGPGPGGLTRALLKTAAAKVIAIEKDDRCLQALAPLLETFPHFQVHHQDALEVDLNQFAEKNCKIWIVANLPYNISVMLLLKWFDLRNSIYQMVLMFQKEVALRLYAKPGTKNYGRLSVISQWHCVIEHQFDIKPGSFYPPPKVVSSVVRLTPRLIKEYTLRPFLEKITFAAFNQRRKMLRVSLQQLGPSGMDALNQSNISPTARPEELTVDDFVNLSKAYQNICVQSQ